jgi:DNA transposition AAA+ family ATPase
MKKTQHWKGFLTLQRKEILSALEESKENQKAVMIISPTGLGKTDTVNLFTQTNPEGTFVVTVGSSYKLEDVIEAICHQVGAIVEQRSFKAVANRKRLQAIADKLAEISLLGIQPVIIIDEAENLQPAVLKTIKELYDAIIDYCGIVLIGTDQILDSMLNKRQKNRTSVPQLYSRFKVGIRNISALNKGRDFKAFFDTYIPKLPGVQSLIIENADSYRDLYNYLEPVLRQCASKNKELTEEYFRFFHKIPNKK